MVQRALPERASSGERPDSLYKTAGTDFGNLACIPWAKGRLGLPYLCGGVRKSGTALVPSRDVVPGPGNTSPTALKQELSEMNLAGYLVHTFVHYLTRASSGE